MTSISLVKLNIAKKLKENKDFRERFFRGQTQDEIAMGLRSLREKRKMKQKELAKKCGMKQSAISRIEQADYSGWSFTTLLRVADALEARLRVILEPAEIVIARYEENEIVALAGSGEYAPFYKSNATEPEIKETTTTNVDNFIYLNAGIPSLIGGLPIPPAPTPATPS
jgi:transcriptional regulator with XRE-family HTH domain